MKLISAESIRRPEVIRWHQRIIERYSTPGDIGIAVLLPCSAKKPYRKSKSHIAFRNQIIRVAGNKYPLIHELSLTSPLGLVPRELEDLYPAAHYDVPVTGNWSEEEKNIVIKLIEDYISKTSVPLIAHLEGPYRGICEESGIETTGGDASILEKRIKEELRGLSAAESDKLRKARAVCDFQFGKGSSDFLFDSSAQLKGFQLHDVKEGLLATLDRWSGFLSLTITGGERLCKYGRYTVDLSFAPETKSIFCPGIERADHDIRPMDEVLVMYQGKVVGVGKANLCGEEMERSGKGLAVSLRHRRAEDV